MPLTTVDKLNEGDIVLLPELYVTAEVTKVRKECRKSNIHPKVAIPISKTFIGGVLFPSDYKVGKFKDMQPGITLERRKIDIYQLLKFYIMIIKEFIEATGEEAEIANIQGEPIDINNFPSSTVRSPSIISIGTKKEQIAVIGTILPQGVVALIRIENSFLPIKYESQTFQNEQILYPTEYIFFYPIRYDYEFLKNSDLIKDEQKCMIDKIQDIVIEIDQSNCWKTLQAVMNIIEYRYLCKEHE